MAVPDARTGRADGGRRVPGTIPAAISGVVAAGVALGVGELVCGLAGSGPSLISAVGTEFIDRFAASLKDLAISLFGTNDKAALVVGIIITSLILGAVLGKASRRRPWVGVLGITAFGVVGLLSYLSDPLGSTATGVVASVLSVAAGIATLLVLLRFAPAEAVAPPDDPPTGDPLERPLARPSDGARSRRTFIVTAGVLAAGAVGAAMIGRRTRTTDVVDAARRQTVLPRPVTSTPAPAEAEAIPAIVGLSPYIIPNGDFYRIDTALVVPQIDPATWSMKISGMVDTPFEIGYDELLDMSDFEDLVTLQCVSNEVGGYLVGNAAWQGVRLKTLLDRAGVQSGATQIVGHSVDGFTAGFPTEVGLDGRTALVAVAMNGEPLPADHGFPARLIIAGLYGYVSATKWLSEIELTTLEAFDGYWIPRGWAKDGPIKIASRIDVPASGATVTPGTQPIAGVAWAPVAGISRVEVQVDDGEWRDATLGKAASGNTWVQWYLEWAAEPGDHDIRVRATNTDGETQTEERRSPAPDGATGWHERSVRVRA